jgi:hypothetical protein
MFDAISVDERADGEGVRLEYHLHRRPWLESLAWSGDFGLDPADLAAVARLALDGNGDDRTIADASERVLGLLHREGFLSARVDPTITENPATNGRRLTMRVTAEKPARLGPVRITGAGQAPGDKIAGAFGLEEGDRYRERAVKDGVEAITTFLHGRNFFDARVHAETSTWDPVSNRLAIELSISEGPRYEVEFSGNEALSAKALMRRMDLAERGPFVLQPARQREVRGVVEQGGCPAPAGVGWREQEGVGSGLPEWIGAHGQTEGLAELGE